MLFLRRTIRFWLLAVACMAAVDLTQAAQRLDSSASPRHTVHPMVTDGQGRALDGRQMPPEVLFQYGRIDYRLATANHVGKQARVYFVMPAHVPGLLSPVGMRAQWQGAGVLADGSARPGERALVWAGRVREPWLNGALLLTYRIDPRQMLPSFGGGIEPYFEIEP